MGGLWRVRAGFKRDVNPSPVLTGEEGPGAKRWEERVCSNESARPSPPAKSGRGALRLLRPRFLDRVAQRLVADRPLQDPVADDEGRSSGSLEVAGELEVPGQLLLGGLSGNVVAQPDVGARLGDRLRAGPAGG